MRRFGVEVHYSLSLFQRFVDPFSFRQGTHHIPVLGADEGQVCHLDTSVSEDARLPVALEPQKLRSEGNVCSRLLQLPTELLVYFMLFLPHSSLYMVRQTCQVLRNLAVDFQFNDFHWEILHHEDPRCHITMPLCEELWNIQRIFLRRSLCKPCGTLFDSGELEERLGNLWRPVYCRGCERLHPELLFSQGGRENNICVGLLGEFTLCKHIKVTGKIDNGEDWGFRCLSPEHFPENSMDSKERSTFNKYRPQISIGSFWGGSVVYSRSFPLVKIAPLQYPGMPSLKSRLSKQLGEIQHDGLCQHASTQLEAILLSLPSGKCDCFPASGPPVYESLFAGRDFHRCENHDYDCRHCGALYYWFFENNYIVLKVTIDLATDGADGMNWLANITFPMDKYPIHPILNESTKGVPWCSSNPSCGTGGGNRWLLMVEILKRLPREGVFGLPRRDRSSAANLAYTLEYQVFQNAAAWMARPNMLSIDLNYPF